MRHIRGERTAVSRTSRQASTFSQFPQSISGSQDSVAEERLRNERHERRKQRLLDELSEKLTGQAWKLKKLKNLRGVPKIKATTFQVILPENQQCSHLENHQSTDGGKIQASDSIVRGIDEHRLRDTYSERRQ